MDKIYKRSGLSVFPLNLFSWLNPNFYIDFLTFYKNYIVLTDTAIVLKKGLVSTNTTEIPYSKINSIRVRQGLLGKLYGFGDVVVLSGNDVVGEVIKGVIAPDNLKADIQEHMNKQESNSQVYQTASREVKRDNLDQLEKLAELKEKGIISEEEFTTKKKKLLGI